MRTKQKNTCCTQAGNLHICGLCVHSNACAWALRIQVTLARIVVNRDRICKTIRALLAYITLQNRCRIDPQSPSFFWESLQDPVFLQKHGFLLSPCPPFSTPSSLHTDPSSDVFSSYFGTSAKEVWGPGWAFTPHYCLSLLLFTADSLILEAWFPSYAASKQPVQSQVTQVMQKWLDFH